MRGRQPVKGGHYNFQKGLKVDPRACGVDWGITIGMEICLGARTVDPRACGVD
jgi:hypothetical protein